MNVLQSALLVARLFEPHSRQETCPLQAAWCVQLPMQRLRPLGRVLRCVLLQVAGVELGAAELETEDYFAVIRGN